MADKIEIPKDITAKDFFEKFVPEQYEKNKAMLPPEARDVSVTATIELKGDGGGIWTIVMDKGAMKVVQGDSPDRAVKMALTVKDWRSGISGERGFSVDIGAMSGSDVGGQNIPPLTQGKIDALKDIEGVLMFQTTHPEKGNWEITSIFGKVEKDEPDCTISVSDETALALQKGETNPPMAFMQGQVKILGDMGLAMRVGTTLMS